MAPILLETDVKAAIFTLFAINGSLRPFLVEGKARMTDLPDLVPAVQGIRVVEARLSDIKTALYLMNEQDIADYALLVGGMIGGFVVTPNLVEKIVRGLDSAKAVSDFIALF